MAPTARLSGAPRTPTSPPKWQRKALAGAGARVSVTRRSGSRSKIDPAHLGARQQWQTEAYDAVATTPELKGAFLRVAGMLSKLRLYVGSPNPDDPSAEPVDVDDATWIPTQWAEAAKAELARLKAPMGGQADIIRMGVLNTDQVGECYLVGETTAPDPAVPDDSAETWQVYSIRECRGSKDGTEPDGLTPRYVWKLYNGPEDTRGRPLDPERSTVIRLWTRGAEWSALADSNMSALGLVCEVLQACTQLQASDAYSRANAGLLLVPNELGYGDDSDPDTEGEGDPDATEVDDDSDPLLEAIDQAISDPIEDPRSSSAQTPTLVRGAAEYLKADVFRHLTLERAALAQLDGRIEALVMRIARGLNMPVEAVTGLMSTTFANAGQVSEDEWELYGEPRATAFVDGISNGYLRPNLLDASCPPEVASQLLVWFDWSALRRDPDLAEDADSALAANAISLDAYRRAKGWEETDAPEPAELVMRMILAGAAVPPELVGAIIKQLDPTLADVEAAPQPAIQMAEAAARQTMAMANLVGHAALAGSARQHVELHPVAALGQGQRAPVGAQLVGIDQGLRTRLLVAADGAMTRALDRAGARLRTAVQGDAQLRARIPRGTRARDVPDLLGRTAVNASASSDDLFADAWDELEGQFRDWATVAGADALEAASRLSAGLPLAQRQALKLRQATDVDVAWSWMRNALGSVAEARLFDPDPAIPVVGEFDSAGRVPAGLVRRAMAIAGGRNDLAVDVTGDVLSAGAWVGIDPLHPAGGIGTGTLVGEAITATGAAQEGWRWVYGPALRTNPFPPHRALDGVEFVNFDDGALTNGSGFPAVDFYMPGDHAGCVCDVEPIIIEPEQT